MQWLSPNGMDRDILYWWVPNALHGRNSLGILWPNFQLLYNITSLTCGLLFSFLTLGTSSRFYDVSVLSIGDITLRQNNWTMCVESKQPNLQFGLNAYNVKDPNLSLSLSLYMMGPHNMHILLCNVMKEINYQYLITWQSISLASTISMYILACCKILVWIVGPTICAASKEWSCGTNNETTPSSKILLLDLAPLCVNVRCTACDHALTQPLAMVFYVTQYDIENQQSIKDLQYLT